MCGITGFFSFDPNTSIGSHELATMTQSLFHRGPDDGGCMLLERPGKKALAFSPENIPKGRRGLVGLGHRRLSIIDLSKNGAQPMVDPEHRIWMVYNGEVYNFKELRARLESLGHVFKSRTDSEVVLKSFCQWGCDCFKEFNGMWAIAFFDEKSGRLTLARDRFGIKPLFFFKDHGRFLFGSEIKSLLAHPLCPKEPNLSKILNYGGRSYRVVDADNHTFFKDIFHLPKSHFCTIDKAGTYACKPYWSLDKLAESPVNNTLSRETQNQFLELLKDAVKLRMVSDVKLASTLSGGMDSTSITCLAAKLHPGMETFSSVSGEGYFDESEYIQSVVDQEGLVSHIITPEIRPLYDIIREMVKAHDEPVCTATWYMHYLISRAIHENGVKVILTGHGADELLAGYWHHYHYAFADLRESGRSDQKEIQHWLSNHNRSMEEYEREKAYIAKIDQNRFLEIEAFSPYKRALSRTILEHDTLKPFESVFSGRLTRRLSVELTYDAVPTLLKPEDRNSMAFSVESRVPFLDYRLVEFCFSLGNVYKIRKGLGKKLLRDVMKGILPEKVRTRKEKVGFNFPIDDMVRTVNLEDFRQMIRSDNYINSQVYNPQELKALLEEHVKGQNHGMFFWQYMNLQLWYERFFTS